MSELTMEETHKSTLEDYPSSLPERHDMYYNLPLYGKSTSAIGALFGNLLEGIALRKIIESDM